MEQHLVQICSASRTIHLVLLQLWECLIWKWLVIKFLYNFGWPLEWPRDFWGRPAKPPWLLRHYELISSVQSIFVFWPFYIQRVAFNSTANHCAMSCQIGSEYILLFSSSLPLCTSLLNLHSTFQIILISTVFIRWNEGINWIFS